MVPGTVKRSIDDFGRFLHGFALNTLMPESEWYLISPFNITPKSSIKVMRIKEMIIN